MVKNYIGILSVLFLISAGLKIRPNSPYLQSKPEQEVTHIHATPPTRASDDVEVAGITGNAGLIQVLNDGSSMFYWFFNRLGGNITTDSVPLIMWLEGGPGVSSLFALFDEFGPLQINETTLTPEPRIQTWASDYHLLYVDNPFGAGYSYANNQNDYVQNETQMAANLYFTLQQLCTLHPAWFSGREFYVFGESYAGKYVPEIANKILLENEGKPNCFIPLSGVGIGDGWTNPAVQTTSYAEYAFSAGLLDESELAQVSTLQRESVDYYNSGDLKSSIDSSNAAVDAAADYAGGVSVYDIRQFSGDPNITAMSDWLNLNSTKTLLGVPLTIPFLAVGQASYLALFSDQMVPASNLLPFLLQNIKVMFYNGQDDLICNGYGTQLFLSQLEWEGLQGYLSAPRYTWYVQDEVAGYARGYQNLTQVIVLKAGHMVTVQQLGNSIDMVNRFINNLGWET